MTKGENYKDGEGSKADRQRERGLVDLLEGFQKNLLVLLSSICSISWEIKILRSTNICLTRGEGSNKTLVQGL